MLDSGVTRVTRVWLIAWVLGTTLARPVTADEASATEAEKALLEARALFDNGDYLHVPESTSAARISPGITKALAQESFELEIESVVQRANNCDASQVNTKTTLMNLADRTIEDMLKYPGLRGVGPTFRSNTFANRLKEIRRSRFGDVEFQVDPPNATVVIGGDTLKAKDGAGRYFERDLPAGYRNQIKIDASGYVPYEDRLQINAGMTMRPPLFLLSRKRGHRLQAAGGAVLAAGLVVLGAVVGRDKPQEQPKELPGPPPTP